MEEFLVRTGYKAYTLYWENVVNVALKYILFICKSIIYGIVPSYESDRFMIADIHFI